MKIPISQNINPIDAIRRCGYGLVNDRNADEQSFARRLGGGFYPRFHIYIENGFYNLHLDQKQASYQGSKKHSGEYDGDTVAAEGERVREMIENLASAPTETSAPEPEKKGFWGNIFGN